MLGASLKSYETTCHVSVWGSALHDMKPPPSRLSSSSSYSYQKPLASKTSRLRSCLTKTVPQSLDASCAAPSIKHEWFHYMGSASTSTEIPRVFSECLRSLACGSKTSRVWLDGRRSSFRSFRRSASFHRLPNIFLQKPTAEV